MLRIFEKSAYLIFLTILILICIPVVALVAVIIFLESGGPVGFRQKRVGFKGKSFVIYKLRTMKKGADKKQKFYRRLNEADGPAFKIKHDPRFTRAGEFLSHTGIDELPQLLNIVRGEMALIGPRPLPVNESGRLTGFQKQRLNVLPGIISPQAITANYHRSFKKWMESDVEYAKNKSFIYDLKFSYKAGLFMIRLMWRELSRGKSNRQNNPKTV